MAGFLKTRRGAVFLKNFKPSVFLGCFACFCIHTLRRFYIHAGPGIYIPYSLYIVLHSLHHNAIVNAAAGVANSRRVSYIADAIARARCAWPQRVTNANSRGVCIGDCCGVGICNCARGKRYLLARRCLTQTRRHALTVAPPFSLVATRPARDLAHLLWESGRLLTARPCRIYGCVTAYRLPWPKP